MRFTRAAIVYLIILICFLLGFYSAYTKSFPYSFLREIHLFVKGDEFESTSLLQKIKGETLKPYARDIVDLTTASSIDNYIALELNGVRDDLLSPLHQQFRASSEPVALMTRHRVDNKSPAIIVLNANREHVATLEMDEQSMNADFPATVGSWSFEILKDGSYIYFNGGASGMHRRDHCGKNLWSTEGFFHHETSYADGRIWVFGLPVNDITRDFHKYWNHFDVINEIDASTGKVLRSISIIDIVRANLDVMDPLLREKAQRKLTDHNVLTQDLWHFNDVDVLPESIAHEYPDFEAGSLLLSARNLNLLLVVNPDTKKILWHSQGHIQVQHDPDWIGNNKITVFNNRFHENLESDGAANYSEIKGYDFSTNQWSVVYNAMNIKAKTEYAGGHDIAKNGNIIMNFDQQGRVVEVNNKGELVWEFANRIEENKALISRIVKFIDTGTYKALTKGCP